MRPPMVLIVILALALSRGGLGLAGLAADPPAAGPDAPAAASPRSEADLAYDEGRIDEARAAYAAVVEQDPDDAEARYRLTLLALLRDDGDEARRHGDALLRLDPAGARGRAVAAALAFVAAPDGAAGTQAAAAARAVLADHPEVLVARWVAARSLLGGGNPCAALPDIDAAIAAAPRFYEFEEMKLAAYNQAGDRAKGGGQLVHMHRKFPDNAAVAGWLFEWYDAAGETGAAADLLGELAGDADEDPAANLRVVDYLRRTRGDAAADAELSRLAEATAGTPLAGPYRAELAASLARQGRGEAAAALLEEVPGLAGTTPQQAADAAVVLAGILDAAGDRDRARALVDEVLRTDATHVGALKARAGWLVEEGRPREALAALRTAQGQDPRDPAILTAMAAAYRLDGSDALAGDSLARAVELSGGGARETALFAEFLRSQGRDAAADALLGPPETAGEPAQVPAPTGGGGPAPAGCPDPAAPGP